MNRALPSRGSAWAAICVVTALAAPPPAQAQSAARVDDCAPCHGELEFLRQHSADLDEARRRLVTLDDIRASAHADSTCGSCHIGFERWPHPEDSSSKSCGSCHPEAADAWGGGVHARPDHEGLEPVPCEACHTEHGSVSLDSLRAGSFMSAMNAVCLECHETSQLPEQDPHRGEIGCASCHLPHATRDVDDPDASVAPQLQAVTCGGCHDEEAAESVEDIHGEVLHERSPLGLATLELLETEAPPACTTCHGGHGMTTVAGPIVMDQAATCGPCHEHALHTFDDSYHGQATALGSVAAATCSDCHGTHGIFGASDPRSMVHEDQLVESCGQCHEASRPAFVLYQPHADHNDKENYPYVYWSYRLMTGLLIGVFTVFGLHSALWIVRLTLDTLRQTGGEA